MYRYKVYFKNGSVLEFEAESDIDFHKLNPGFVSFNDLIINLNQVNCIKKFEEKIT